ncbi:MAG TPA: cupin domain-containing protein [Pyrinomonadaceae bacterium]|nr:cupin domain-containing protein [Pyrinomonadaceae bacterium]
MKYLNSRTKITAAIGAALLVVSGVVYAAIIPVILGVGTNADAPLVGGPATVTFRQLTTTPGDVGAWHYHPGYVHNVVTSGAIKIEDGCGSAPSYSTGQAFETSQGRVHRAVNEGTVDAVEYNVFIREAGKPLTRFIPNNERRCGPPSTVDECMNNGWSTFDFPSAFGNQGACVKFVTQRNRVSLLVPEDPLQ